MSYALIPTETSVGYQDLAMMPRWLPGSPNTAASIRATEASGTSPAGDDAYSAAKRARQTLVVAMLERAMEPTQPYSAKFAVLPKHPAFSTQAGPTVDVPLDDHFDTNVSRLVKLLREDDAEDRPTPYAFEQALHLLMDIRHAVNGPFPRASVATAADQGIHVYWKRPDRYIKLSIPARSHETGYIYHEQGQEFGVEGLSPQTLAKWTRWLTNV